VTHNADQSHSEENMLTRLLLTLLGKAGTCDGRPDSGGVTVSRRRRPLLDATCTPALGRSAAVLVISGSVGAGHDGAASELATRLRAQGVHADVHDYLAALPWPCRYVLREGYTFSVGRAPAVFEWLFASIEDRRLVLACTLAFCRLGNRRVHRWATAKPYGLVVSTYPLASQTLGTLRRRGELTSQVATYLTDPAVHRTWVHPAVDHHLTVTGAAAHQGQAVYGIAMRPAGPLVPDRFSRGISPERRSALRHELGLRPDQRVALLVTGSLGLGDAEHSACGVLDAGLVPLVLCGRNEALRARLTRIPGVVALGWRDDVHELMHTVDVLVHNAGGLTFTEALVAGLPTVSYRCIPGHGRANAAAIEDAGLGPWARSPEQFTTALREQAAKRRILSTQPDPSLLILSLLDGTATNPATAGTMSVSRPGQLTGREK